MSRGRGKSWVALVAALIVVFAVQTGAASADPPDYATPGEAFNVLPPGQAGFPPLVGANVSDQIPLYDGLTPRKDNVTAADLPNFFKQNVFGLGNLSANGVTTFPSRPGLTITRDTFGVPHIVGDTRNDVMYGVGYVTAQDRGALMDILRGPGRAAALDAPGLNPFGLALSFQPFNPSQQTEDYLASQVDVVMQHPDGQRIVDDIDNYLQGINDFRTQSGNTANPWTRNDVIASAALIAAVFGKGGGDEARRAQFLSGLKDRLGKHKGEDVWEDLRQANDPETSVTLDRSFSYRDDDDDDDDEPSRKGNAILDAGSIDTSAAQNAALAQASQASASNAVLVGAKRSATGRPYFVAGPQVGYFFPQILMEIDVHGGGVDARGATFPGAGPYVELGRGIDFSWSATSANNDNIDIFVEELCGDDTHYLFKGQCREMTTFDAGTVGNPAKPVVFRETVHGPVIGYATVKGKRVALSSARTTRGREVASAFGFADLNTNEPKSAKGFFRTVSQIEFTFNWFYADKRDVAMFSSGLLPERHRDVDMGLPTKGTGRYEWRGFLDADDHPHGTAPRDGTIINWNNKPARGWEAADDEWSYGSVHRNNLLERTIDGRTHTLASTVAGMNKAATQDLRAVVPLGPVLSVLGTGPAPNARVQRMVELLADWRAQGSHRLDLDDDTKIDHAGAAILDKAWNKLADAVMSPVLGPQLDELASLIGRDNRANNQGSSYGSGWYSYVDKDLRTLLRQRVRERYDTKFCGNGSLSACRAALYAALDQAATELQTEQGSANPDDWRSSATPERIRFNPGLLPTTMRWTNRPTFQQAISFSGHR